MKAKPAERRRYIWQTVARDGIVSLEKVKGQFPGINNQNIQDDLQALRDLGHNIVSVPDSKDKRKSNLVDRDARHTASKDPREQLNRQGKKAVAKMVMSIICGFPEASTLKAGDSEIISVPAYLANCPSVGAIEKQIRSHNSIPNSNYRSVLRRLENYWCEMARAVAIDSGTTNDHTVSLLRDLPLPSRFSSLAALTVCTNGRGMFQALGDVSVDSKVIMIGGEQVAKSEAVAGRLAELFLKSAGLLNFGIGIVGTTMVNLKEMTINSDSHEEASLKALIFQKSAIRVVAFDNSKLISEPVRSSFPFVSIDPNQVDILVTNKPRSDEGQSEFENAILDIRSLGVTVLTW